MDRPNTITDASASATSSDEAVKVCLLWQAARARQEELEHREHCAKEAGDSSAETYFGHAAQYAYDEEMTHRAMLPVTKATSLTGAAGQILEAMNIIDMMLDQFPTEARTFDTKKDERAINRLLYSAFELVESVADQKLADIAPNLVQANLNPWTPVEDRIAAIRNGRAA